VEGLAVLSSAIIDLVIGLVFLFAVTAALSSAATELISRFLGLRGAYLLTGLRELVDSGELTTDLGKAATTAYQEWQKKARGDVDAPEKLPSAASALLGGPILGSQGMVGQISERKLKLEPSSPPASGFWARLGRMFKPGQLAAMTANGRGNVRSERRSLPAYISAASFADAVIDLVVPDAHGQTTMTTIRDNVNDLPETPLTLSLQALAKNAGDDVTRFRTAVERWYDDHMDRVTGWYKRHVAVITLVVGAILVILLNIDALTIGRTLYTDNTVRTAVSAVAARGTNCAAGQTQQQCLSRLSGQLSAAATAGLPIGWGTVRDCAEPKAQCNWLDQRGLFSRHGNSGWQLVLALVGFLIMVIALVPGAQFWFGLLSKLGSLRSTGPKPADSGS
jgi:hypothetical protein